VNIHDEIQIDKDDPASVRAAWCTMLRSGMFQQGRGQLGCDAPHLPAPKYCCWGVLTLLLEGENWGDEVSSDGVPRGQKELLNSHGSPFYASEEVSSAVGMWGLSIERELARANDDGETFAQIADRIESFPG
jgi:hypothetical protein